MRKQFIDANITVNNGDGGMIARHAVIAEAAVEEAVAVTIAVVVAVAVVAVVVAVAADKASSWTTQTNSQHWDNSCFLLDLYTKNILYTYICAVYR